MFLLTERCNARCVHCDIWKNRGKEESPGFAGWSRVLDDLLAWLGPVPIVFTGGEAMLQPFALDLVRYATGLGFHLEVLTHGYWEDQPRIEKLALAGPARITISVDGIGELHNTIRGREKFFDRTSRTIETAVRVREERKLPLQILLKTVIMEQNLDGVCDVARYATSRGVDVFYQPIEQNYNTPADPLWFSASVTWPRDIDKAVATVEELLRLKRDGLNIVNSERQLEVMIPYFRDPVGRGAVTKGHLAHQRKPQCSVNSMAQLNSNGDVVTCSQRPPIGNVKTTPFRQIWENRPGQWAAGCCLWEGHGGTDASPQKSALPILQ